MKQAGLDVYQDGNPYVMHHKSSSWTTTRCLRLVQLQRQRRQGQRRKILLIVDDAGFARPFVEEFDRVLAAAKDPPQRERERPRPR